jgi:PAS domain S-box-containing protein
LTDYLDVRGNIAGVTTAALDITSHKRIEEALREREEMLSLALGACGSGTWSWNLERNACKWSDEYFRILGFEPGSLEPSEEAGLSRIHPDDLLQYKEAVQSAIENRTQMDLVYRVIWLDSSIHWVRALSRTYYNEHDQPVRMSGIAIDITGQKQVEIEPEAEA